MFTKLKKFLMTASVSVMALSPLPIYAEETNDIDNTIRILFTGNLRNCLESTKVRDTSSNTLVDVGGYSSLYTTLKENRTENTLQLDMGNYASGNGIYDCLYSTGESYTLLKKLGYDCVGVGNKDLYTSVEDLNTMYSSVEEKPEVVASNLSGWNGNSTTIIEKGGTSFGIFSIISNRDTLDVEDEIEAASSAVKVLKDTQFTVCLYDGTLEEGKELAEQVDGISLMLCSGEIDITEKVEKVDDTLLLASGAYGQYVGVLDLYKDSLTLKDYDVVQVQINKNAEINTLVNDYTNEAQNILGVKFDTVVGHTQIDLGDALLDDLSTSNTKTQDFVLDSYAEAYTSYPDRTSSYAIAVSNKDSFKGGIYEGDIKVKDIYNCADIGSDGKLYTAYILGSDIKKLCELDHLLGDTDPIYKLAFSGVKYTYLDKRTTYNKVKDVYIAESTGYWVKIDTSKYYPIVFTDSFLKVIQGSRIIEDGNLEVHLYKSVNGTGEIQDSIEDCVMVDSHGKVMTCIDYIEEYIQNSKKNKNSQHDITSVYKSSDSFRTSIKYSLSNLLLSPSEYALNQYIFYGKIIGCVLVGLFLFTKIWNACHPYRKG